ncbi:MAG: MFS transporter [Thermomicrobiales bacterium]|nr:MFS transporter [Thermomicrobiales bacterium]
MSTGDTVLDAPPEHEEKPSFGSVLRDPGVRALLLSRFATMLGIATLSYGLMVYLATAGAPQATVSLIGGIRFFAALLFGIAGGALTESMSKRGAMVSAYALQAAVCFILPVVWGTSLPALVVLVFVISALAQVVAPAVKAATALVSTPAQVATVAAIIALAGGLGAALGSAFFAPFLISSGSLRILIYACGAITAFGAVRALWVPDEEGASTLRQAVKALDWRETTPSLGRAMEWMVSHRALASMVLVGALATGLFEGFNTLIPIYIRDVLQANPALTVFILAPGGLGAFLGTVVGPGLMQRRGERSVALMALALLTLSFALFGMIDQVAPLISQFSLLRVTSLVGIDLNPEVQAAGMIAILTSFGSTGATAAVQAYINRYVFLERQASTFGMQNVIESAVSLLAVVVLGALASLVGSRAVFIVAPIFLTFALVLLIRFGLRTTQEEYASTRVVLHSLFGKDAPAEAAPGTPVSPAPETEAP